MEIVANVLTDLKKTFAFEEDTLEEVQKSQEKSVEKESMEVQTTPEKDALVQEEQNKVHSIPLCLQHKQGILLSSLRM